ncbi:MAG: hypothetical protein NC391_03045, partial [Alistipes timonensis]|nr:hypothetical protein [Alistipes timonensis]
MRCGNLKSNLLSAAVWLATAFAVSSAPDASASEVAVAVRSAVETAVAERSASDKAVVAGRNAADTAAV